MNNEECLKQLREFVEWEKGHKPEHDERQHIAEWAYNRILELEEELKERRH